MKNNTIVDTLIDNIKNDQTLLEKKNAEIEQAKEAKREISERLKAYRKDVNVLIKYVDPKKQEALKALGFGDEKSKSGLNTVADIALNIVVKSKDNTLTNAELYEAYIKALDNEKDAVNYTEFNIKCRSLYNTKQLIRKKGNNPKSSRSDIISLNRSILDKDKKEF